jgi:hypothetical protein
MLALRPSLACVSTADAAVIVGQSFKALHQQQIVLLQKHFTTTALNTGSCTLCMLQLHPTCSR